MQAEKVLEATAGLAGGGAGDEEMVLARALALRAKGLILRDQCRMDQYGVAVQCHKDAVALLAPLVDKGHSQAKLETVVNLGEWVWGLCCGRDSVCCWYACLLPVCIATRGMLALGVMRAHSEFSVTP